ncbi:MAG: hypothetical protein M4579_001547 [Chaenotheca gracillima]|nr:MAG: hypothetical protein M4579_001547 [Chaenotheca gracillima]
MATQNPFQVGTTDAVQGGPQAATEGTEEIPSTFREPLTRLLPVPKTEEEKDAAQTTDYVSWTDENWENNPRNFEYDEHAKLGDVISLQDAEDRWFTAWERPFKLPNGLELTYGQINGLAGDFYGTIDPISSTDDSSEQATRFLRAWNWLAVDTSRNPREAKELLDLLQEEVDAVAKALRAGEDPSTAYEKLPGALEMGAKFQSVTVSRPKEAPGFYGLALINFDHFGADARKAYNAGHHEALKLAAQGKPEHLILAYAMNAFADHFLEDSFAAGHMRVPRRILSTGYQTQYFAKVMHDEDNAIGLEVRNPAGESWRAYGDKRLLDEVDHENKNRCWNALRASVDEIHEAWKSGVVPDKSTFKAWEHAPTLESVFGHQELAPLFTPQGERREDISDRRTWKFISDWTEFGTSAKIYSSNIFDYPIHM